MVESVKEEIKYTPAKTIPIEQKFERVIWDQEEYRVIATFFLDAHTLKNLRINPVNNLEGQELCAALLERGAMLEDALDENHEIRPAVQIKHIPTEITVLDIFCHNNVPCNNLMVGIPLAVIFYNQNTGFIERACSIHRGQIQQTYTEAEIALETNPFAKRARRALAAQQIVIVKRTGTDGKITSYPLVILSDEKLVETLREDLALFLPYTPDTPLPRVETLRPEKPLQNHELS